MHTAASPPAGGSKWGGNAGNPRCLDGLLARKKHMGNRRALARRRAGRAIGNLSLRVATERWSKRRAGMGGRLVESGA